MRVCQLEPSVPPFTLPPLHSAGRQEWPRTSMSSLGSQADEARTAASTLQDHAVASRRVMVTVPFEQERDMMAAVVVRAVQAPCHEWRPGIRQWRYACTGEVQCPQ